LTQGFAEHEENKKPRRRRRRRGGRKPKASSDAPKVEAVAEVSRETESTKNKVVIKKKSRQASSRVRKKAAAVETKEVTEPKADPVAPKKPRKTIYGGSRRSVTSDEVQASQDRRG